MNVSGEYIFDAPQALTWESLQDPEVLASIMPGGEDFKEVGENEYSGLLNVKVGPVQGQFTGVIKLYDILAPEGYSMQVDGRGAPGFVKANGSLKLTGQGEKTAMTYVGEAQIGGRIASVGQRVLEASMKSILRQSLDGLNEYLKVQAANHVAEEEEAGPVVEAQEVVPAADPPPESGLSPESGLPPESTAFTPPSQSTIARNVFLDVFNDLLPAQYRPVAIGVVIVVAIIILYQILR
jgi:carbon monoxide dehydrogenase subunit G